MSKSNSYVAKDGSFVQDITQLFMPTSDDTNSLSSFTSRIEGKGLKGLKQSDFLEIIEHLKGAQDKLDTQDNQIMALKSDNAQQKRLNMEMCTMIDQFKESGRQDPETNKQIQSVVKAFRHDMFVRFFLLSLDDV